LKRTRPREHHQVIDPAADVGGRDDRGMIERLLEILDARCVRHADPE